MFREDKSPNRLIKEKSPYLQQHAYNPVDWHPWGEEAFNKAKAENKPIFLSIGYTACHWCHVMERESFSDETVAGILNKDFIPVKVDREERPDVDSVYMKACQMLTGSGGWPLSAWLTPDKKPFHAATYYPRDAFINTLDKISSLWQSDKGKLQWTGKEVTKLMEESEPSTKTPLDAKIYDKAYRMLEKSFDREYGGFGNAPKFPAPHNLLFLLRLSYVKGSESALKMVDKTLKRMQLGGIYDHIGFGFCRYSTDRYWLVPHFEKMLYDNALLCLAYTEAHAACRNEGFARTARNIARYVIDRLLSTEGAFYSSEDADSQGVEGLFYLWSVKEVVEVLGEKDGIRFCEIFNITESPNFEHGNIPYLAAQPEDPQWVELCREKLLNVRKNRPRPMTDDKILTGWNGLMIAALAVSGRVLQNDMHISTAKKCADFILSNLYINGRLYSMYKDGRSETPGFLEDYAYLIWGLSELYQSSFIPEYLKIALELTDSASALFWDKKNGGYFISGVDTPRHIVNIKDSYDGALPSGNSVMAYNLVTLYSITKKSEYDDMAMELFSVFGESVKSQPFSSTHMLSAFMYRQESGRQITISGQPAKGLLKKLRKGYEPFTTALVCDAALEGAIAWQELYKPLDGRPAAYVCTGRKCEAPVTEDMLVDE